MAMMVVPMHCNGADNYGDGGGDGNSCPMAVAALFANKDKLGESLQPDRAEAQHHCGSCAKQGCNSQAGPSKRQNGGAEVFSLGERLRARL